MARKKKSVLNQKSEEPKMGVVEENKIGWVNLEPEQDTKKIVEEAFNTELQKEVDKTLEEKIKVVEVPKGVVGRLEQNEISLKDSGEKISEALKTRTDSPINDDKKIEEPEIKENVVIKPTKEQLSRLSKSGLRWYQRTGMLPK